MTAETLLKTLLLSKTDSLSLETLAAGLGTAALLTADITSAPLIPQAGEIEVRRIIPDEELLESHAVPAERHSWWVSRIGACSTTAPSRSTVTSSAT